MSVGDHVHRS